MRLRHVRVLIYLMASLLLSGCVGSSQSLGPPLPETAARSDWILDIIYADPIKFTSLLHYARGYEQTASLSKKERGRLPDAYWELYQQELEFFQYALFHTYDEAEYQYDKDYRDELSRLDDATLQAIAKKPGALVGMPWGRQVRRANARFATYFKTGMQSEEAAIEAHQRRMTLMDLCWNAQVKP